MSSFGKPQAISAKVASTLHEQGHHKLLDDLHQGVRTFDVRLKDHRMGIALPKHMPNQISLFFDGRNRAEPTQLHLDNLPVPRNFWSYNANNGVLSWHFKDGHGKTQSGHLTALNGGSSLQGSLLDEDTQYGVQGVLAPITYLCSVASDTGAFVTGTPPALQLHYDTNDDRWKSANWIEKALDFTYQIKGQVIVGQPTYNIVASFKDEQTGTSWKPEDLTMLCVMDANSNFTFHLNQGAPAADDRSSLPAPQNSIKTVFPYMMQFHLENASMNLVGAMLTESDSQLGTVLGVKGVFQNPSIKGYYGLTDDSGNEKLISVHDGQLHIDHQPVATSAVKGSQLLYHSLSDAQQKATGLPA
ncbi:hypothetical protein ACH42_03370 [Endozoicomonas sp. (ex Bugula neritina AB1)]|nr:hypothetical protein ACH42_03370 [Endozoicomonas sp. (ex Bugula neritina AB1)]